jgi:transposase-like protein
MQNVGKAPLALDCVKCNGPLKKSEYKVFSENDPTGNHHYYCLNCGSKFTELFNNEGELLGV